MRIRYEEVVASYEAGLLTRLRGFRSSHDFLETWVHDTDPTRSILNMVEAAQLGGLSFLEVQIGPEAARAIDLARLHALASGVGKAEIAREGADAVLKVSL